MPLNPSIIKAVIFDYGNTLVEFGPKQVVIQNESLLSLLSELFGPCDRELFSSIRYRQIIAPYDTDEFIENDRDGICIELIEELYGITPDSSQIRQMLETKQQTFVNSIELPDFVIPLLEDLSQRYRLAFISNFPCGDSVRESLKRIDLYKMFDSIVISGEEGVVKPHKKIFEKSLSELSLSPEECVYIGDNWLADIQGAKRVGMQAVHTIQYVSYENFKPFDGDLQPDAVIRHLNELKELIRGTQKRFNHEFYPPMA